MSKITTLILSYILSLSFLHAEEATKETPKTKQTKNEVILLPTIHTGHIKQGEFYNIEHLTKIITELKADIICTEITPLALEKIKAGKKHRRISFFPEYTKAILPLKEKLGYLVIPCSAYSPKVNYKTVGLKAMDAAHYKLIAKALDQHTHQGKRIIIAFGSGHINGLLTHLRTRSDITITDYRPTLNKQRREAAE